MASKHYRGDEVVFQVRKKERGIVVFSESKCFPRAEEKVGAAWAERLEKELASKGAESIQASRTTIGALIRRHRDYIASLRPGGKLGRSLEQNYDYMAQQMDAVRLDRYRAKDLIDFAIRRKKEGVKPATTLSNLSVVSATLNAASHAHGIKIDLTELNDAMKVMHDRGLVAKSDEVVRIIDDDEDAALMSEFRRRNSMPQTEINMEWCYRLGLFLPRRAGELTRITWADLNTKRRTITIRDVKHPRKKIGNDQVVPLVQEAWDLLEELPRVGREILPYNTESMLAAFERTVDRIAETSLASIADVRFHDVRHTGITMLFWRGLQIPEVALISGHTNWTQLKRYTHIRPEDVHRKLGWSAPRRSLAPQERVVENVHAAITAGVPPQAVAAALVEDGQPTWDALYS